MAGGGGVDFFMMFRIRDSAGTRPTRWTETLLEILIYCKASACS